MPFTSTPKVLAKKIKAMAKRNYSLEQVQEELGLAKEEIYQIVSAYFTSFYAQAIFQHLSIKRVQFSSEAKLREAMYYSFVHRRY